MFYTIYKTTNLVNNKIYIGKHQTKNLNDGYIGSGKLLKSAIVKYGLENFEKEILFTFDNESDMNVKEAELVTEEFVKEDTNYNLCPGGKGGWGYVNEFILTNRDRVNNGRIGQSKNPGLRIHERKDFREILKKASKARVSCGKPFDTFKGKKHTEETKQKISKTNSEKQSGRKNSQFGTMWITDGKENKKIKKDLDFIPEGWYKGRISKI